FQPSSSREAPTTDRPLLLYLFWNSMNQGISSLQPSHQVAQKSSKTTRPLYAERSTDAPFESLRATSGRGFRDAAGVRSAGALVVRAKDVASKVISATM